MDVPRQWLHDSLHQTGIGLLCVVIVVILGRQKFYAGLRESRRPAATLPGLLVKKCPMDDEGVSATLAHFEFLHVAHCTLMKDPR